MSAGLGRTGRQREPEARYSEWLPRVLDTQFSIGRVLRNLIGAAEPCNGSVSAPRERVEHATSVRRPRIFKPREDDASRYAELTKLGAGDAPGGLSTTGDEPEKPRTWWNTPWFSRFVLNVCPSERDIPVSRRAADYGGRQLQRP